MRVLAMVWLMVFSASVAAEGIIPGVDFELGVDALYETDGEAEEFINEDGTVFEATTAGDRMVRPYFSVDVGVFGDRLKFLSEVSTEKHESEDPTYGGNVGFTSTLPFGGGMGLNASMGHRWEHDDTKVVYGNLAVTF